SHLFTTAEGIAAAFMARKGCEKMGCTEQTCDGVNVSTQLGVSALTMGPLAAVTSYEYLPPSVVFAIRLLIFPSIISMKARND
ncbi:hypothetical protein ABTM47_19565, partial [Acinetobacter baumannii]